MNRQKFSRLAGLLMAFGILSTAIMSSPFVTHAQTASFTLSANPEIVNVGDEVQLVVNINSEGAEITSAEISINYDDSALKYVGVVSSNAFDQYLQQTSAGNVKVSGLKIPPQSYSGSGVFATVRFKAISQSQSAGMNINTAATNVIDKETGNNIFQGSGSDSVLINAPIDQTPPAIPEGFSVNNPQTGTSLNLSWSNPSDSDFIGVSIYRSTSSGDLGDVIESGFNGTSYSDTGLTKGVTYYYTLKSMDSNENISGPTTQIGAAPSVPEVIKKVIEAPKETEPKPAAPVAEEKTEEPEEEEKVELIGVEEIPEESLPEVEIIEDSNLQLDNADKDNLPDYWELLHFGTLELGNEDDPDNDGLINYIEYTKHSDPRSADGDADGLTDKEEIMTHGTDPFEADSDYDGISDREEIELGTDPNNPDTDGDGVLDGTERNAGSNPLDGSSVPVDENNNNVDDEWEKENLDYDTTIQTPGVTDSDKDGISDTLEFQYGTDPNNPDTDGDGLSDGEEVNTFLTSPTDKKSNREAKKIAITNPTKNATIIDSRPVFLGVAKANAQVAILQYTDEGKSVLIAEGQADESGKFRLQPRAAFREGKPLTFAAVAVDQNDKILETSAKITITIDSSLDVPTPPLVQELDGKEIDPEDLLGDIEITVENNQPSVKGRAYFGARVFVTWQSLLFTSSLIADTSEGEFDYTSPIFLEEGEHTLTLYAIKDNIRSRDLIIPFIVQKAEAAEIAEVTEEPEMKEAAPMESMPLYSIAGMELGLYESVFGGLIILMLVLLIASFLRARKESQIDPFHSAAPEEGPQEPAEENMNQEPEEEEILHPAATETPEETITPETEEPSSEDDENKNNSGGGVIEI